MVICSSLDETKAVDWKLKGKGTCAFLAKQIWNTVPQVEFLSHEAGGGIEVAGAHDSNSMASCILTKL